MRNTKLLMVIVAVSGCSSVDADVRPRIIEATMTIDASAPDALADISWSVAFDTDYFAERDVLLRHVAIIGDYDSQPFEHVLAFQFPADFDGKVDGDGEAPLRLVNQGATNGELEFLCGQGSDRDLAAFVQIEYADGNSLYTPFAVANYQVTCR